MLAFHESWSWVAVATTGVTGLWGIGLTVTGRPAPRAFGYGVGSAVAAVLIQVAGGLWLYGQGRRTGDGFHVFYGVLILITLALAYVYRAQLARRPALSYGLLLLFVMGLALRAWAYVL